MDQKKLKRFIMHNQMNLIIGIISLLAFVIGIFAIGFLKAFFIVGIIDILLFVPNILNVFKKKKRIKGKPKVESSSSRAKASVKKESNVVSSKPFKKKEKKKKGKFKTFLKWFLIFCFIIGIALCIVALVFFMGIAKEAPEFDPHKLDRQESTILYSTDGAEIIKIGAQKREKITYDQLPEVLVNAIVATEDSRYFKHNGFDLPRFLKASVKQVLGKGGGGASTITMQVSKNNYTSRKSEGFEGIKRKFTDIYMAIFKIEKKYTKEQVLEFYVNDNYMGGGAYGVEQACLTYFGKHAKDINLAEAAMIAGLFQSPSGYDPFLNPEACEKRRKNVLYLMNRHGYITEEEKKIAEQLTVDKLLKETTQSESTGNKYMSFVNLVTAEIQDDLGLDPYTTPMKIYTTLNTAKQDEINKILTGETYNWKNPAVDAGVAMIDTKTGAIMAISGGRHKMYDAKVLNYATIKHQIGSTAKPLFDYGPAIEYLNWSTGQLIVDEEHGYSSGGNVNNWDMKYMGLMTIQDALRMSRNIPAIKTFQALDNKDIQKFTSNLHLSPEITDGVIHEAHSIGGYSGESPVGLAAAYNAFANGGYYVTPHSYSKIEYRETGEVVEKKVEKTKAMSEETAYMVMSMLLETPSYALGPFANIPGVTYGAKTGTTNFDTATFKSWGLPTGAVNDFWVVGSSPDYTISLWYGYDSLKRENIDAGYINKVGDYQHEKLFQILGTALFEPGTSFTRPEGVIEVAVEKDTYPLALPSENTPSSMITTALFKKGTEPTEASSRFAFQALNDVSELKGSSSGGKVTLTWNPSSSPTATSDGLRNMYQGLFKTSGFLESFISNYIGINNSVLGSLEYHIYRKTSDGSLSLLEKTTNTQITFTDKTSGNNTYVVKACYSNLASTTSNGVEVKVTVEATNDDNQNPDDTHEGGNSSGGNGNSGTQNPKPSSNISIMVNGSKSIRISQAKPFDETGIPYIMVTETIDGSLMDVTRNAKIVISHESFDYSKVGTVYPVTIKVSYKGTTKTLELKAIIE